MSEMSNGLINLSSGNRSKDSYGAISIESSSPSSPEGYFPQLQNGNHEVPPPTASSIPSDSSSPRDFFRHAQSMNDVSKADKNRATSFTSSSSTQELYMLSKNHTAGGNGNGSFYNITRPSGHEQRKNSVVNVDELSLRLDLIQNIRPKKLVGNIKALDNWKEKYMDLNSFPLSKRSNKKLRDFYEKQNQFIDRYVIIDKLLDSGIHMGVLEMYNSNTNLNRNGLVPGNIDFESGLVLGYDKDGDSKIVYFAIVLNFMINFFLLFGKILVTINTLSMSIIASLIDSVLDMLSTLIIYLANKFSNTQDSRFPIGRKRLEPLGVLVFSVIIIISFLQVAQGSINRLWTDLHRDSSDIEIVKLDSFSLGIMVSTIVVKLGCFFWCTSINNSSVQALAEDAKTDIVFNFFSIVFPVIGDVFQIWWIDSVGALSLSIYVIWQWVSIAFEHINNLTGANASVEDTQQILYLCMRFAESIEKITNLKAYHIGDDLQVEVDITLNYTKYSMKDCHDLGESLQYAIETLPYVERCFVHIDYRQGNFEGHLVA